MKWLLLPALPLPTICASFAAVAAEPATQLPMGEIVVSSDAPQLLVAAGGDYPPMSLRLGQEGRVGLRLTIGVDGRAGDIVVAESSGHRTLDLAAVRRAEAFRWR